MGTRVGEVRAEHELIWAANTAVCALGHSGSTVQHLSLFRSIKSSPSRILVLPILQAKQGQLQRKHMSHHPMPLFGAQGILLSVSRPLLLLLMRPFVQ